ncbi:CDP-diacylglycerol--serine O-phosphatidyltransferase [Tissierella sp. MSJ-40]|uniref:CDP-diacylglycerol--serine O-phosphatidyltransferase n=1 Tax=Tissierella simiarum TaxID=2841534 RepID=A0ABS6E9V6_9FIRM|nr:CDP-diacylglycerol--serine O-phosphatidyltransferase [Tissierella simiarum]MBU5438983.1 CDP-diacylglycerol--serine O-phosphatidyltransferase [Tissierella simiarum]
MLEARPNKYQKYYVLPTLITYSNMMLGATAILIINNRSLKELRVSCILVLLAAITDKLDGFVARRLNMTSDFGKQLDSLCDLVSFGLAPVIIGWNMGINLLGSIGIVTSLIFIGAGIFRLARFNVTKDDTYIIGLPITMSGAIMTIKYIMDYNYKLKGNIFAIAPYDNIILMAILSLLMISNFKIKKPKLLNKSS